MNAYKTCINFLSSSNFPPPPLSYIVKRTSANHCFSSTSDVTKSFLLYTFHHNSFDIEILEQTQADQVDHVGLGIGTHNL